jgi:hypothetical protein
LYEENIYLEEPGATTGAGAVGGTIGKTKDAGADTGGEGTIGTGMRRGLTMEREAGVTEELI